MGGSLLFVLAGGSDPQPAPLEVHYGIVDPPVVAQRDITVRVQTSIHPLDPDPKPLECSSLASIGDRLLLTSDRHSHVIFSLPLSIGRTLDIGLPEPQQVIRLEKELLLDAECMTAKKAGRAGWMLYVLCSLSNDPSGDRRVKRQHMARIPLDDSGNARAQGALVLSGETIRSALHEHFEALDVPLYESFNSESGENTTRWGSVEGISWTPTGGMLLCGLRNPLAGQDAMLFALEGIDEAFDADDAALVRVVDLFRLDLSGRGVSDLAWDPVTEGYLITAALSNGPKVSAEQVYPLENLQSALFWWSGHKADRPIQVAALPDLNVDAVCRVGRSTLIALGSDEGDVSEGRRGRQSVITLVHFTGLDQTRRLQ